MIDNCHWNSLHIQHVLEYILLTFGIVIVNVDREESHPLLGEFGCHAFVGYGGGTTYLTPGGVEAD
jgi:hypothetical protein